MEDVVLRDDIDWVYIIKNYKSFDKEDWYYLSTAIPYNILKKVIDHKVKVPYDIQGLSKNKTIPLSFITEEWDFDEISKSPMLTFEFAKEHLSKINLFNVIYYHPEFSFKLLSYVLDTGG